MNIREMHYDFKKKFNKIDTQVNRNLLVPEIDWTLNEAEGLYVKMVAQPRVKNQLGFETSQRTIDDIRTIVVEDFNIVPTLNVLTIPANYDFFVKGFCTLNRNNCSPTPGRLHIRQHDDEFEESTFDRSSYSWRWVNGVFNASGIRLFTDGTFTISDAKITYIRKRAYMHNAQDFQGGTYNHPSGAVLTGAVNCELPAHTHSEIVDLAVLIASGEVQTSDYQVKLNKLNFNQLT